MEKHINHFRDTKKKVRLIDADALMKNGWHLVQTGESNRFLQSMSLADAPTVDAVEVVHGRWEQQQGLYSCSECGKTCPYDVQADTIMYWTCNYCPSCGAKMDGERKDNG